MKHFKQFALAVSLALASSLSAHADDLTQAFETINGVTISSLEAQGEWTVKDGLLYNTSGNAGSVNVKIDVERPVKLTLTYGNPVPGDYTDVLDICIMSQDGNRAGLEPNPGTPATTRCFYLPSGRNYIYLDDSGITGASFFGQCKFEYTETIEDGEYAEGDYTFSKCGVDIRLTSSTLAPIEWDTRVITLPESFHGFDYLVSASALGQWHNSEWDGEYYVPYFTTCNVPAAVYSLPWLNFRTSGMMGNVPIVYNIMATTSPIAYNSYTSSMVMFTAKVRATYENAIILRQQHKYDFEIDIIPNYYVQLDNPESGWTFDYASFYDIDDLTCGFAGIKFDQYSNGGPVAEYTIPLEVEGKQVTEIDLWAVKDIAKVKLQHSVPPAMSPYVPVFFNGEVNFYVPMAYYETYKQADVWQDVNLFVEAEFYVDGIGYAVSASSEGECWAVAYDGKGTDIVVPSSVQHPETGMEYEVTAIGNKAFHDCDAITSVVVSEGIRSIGAEAFSDCWRLASVILPSSLEEIGAGAFLVCPKFSTITSYAATPPTLLGYLTSYAPYPTVYVPYGSYEAYSSAYYWNECNIVEMEKPDEPDTPSDSVRGDLNGDGVVDVTDLNIVIDIICGE